MNSDGILFSCKENIINNSNITEEIDILDDCSAYIGFGSIKLVNSIRSLSIIGFTLNLIFLIFQFLRIKRKKKKNVRKNSMRQLFQILPLFDCISSVYWIISSFIFVQARDIKNDIGFCTGLAFLYIVCFTFQFVMINCILIHFRKINLNPMDGILKPNKNVIIYVIISLIFGMIVGIFFYEFNVIGRSPMNTCFINTSKNAKYGLFFLINIILIIIAIIQIIIDLCCRGMFITDKGIRKIYKKNSLYVLIFSILHFPMLNLILQTSIQKQGGISIPDNRYSIFSSCVTLFTSMIPLLIGLIRYFQGLTKVECINELLKNNSLSKKTYRRTLSNSINIKKDSNGNINANLSLEADPYEWLENHVMECFMRDILIGIAAGLKKSKKYGDIMIHDIGNSMELERYNINFKNLEEFDLQDDYIKDSEYLNVKVINYAPKSFAYLRKIERIDIDEMIKSFLPKNNRNGLSKSQGKSGSFFISTDDNKYMIKSLKSDEIDLIRNGFLTKYIQHIYDTQNKSLLCRLYGMFNIILAQGDEILIIVMRNVIGDLKDNTVVKFDLKGSTYNRKTDFDDSNFNNKVMKDLNFNEIEKNIMIGQSCISQLRIIITQDSKFLCNSGLMDYSLFLVKITLNKKEAEDIFGENIQKNQDNAVKQLFSGQLSSDNESDQDNNKIIDNENSILKIDDMKMSYNGKGNYHDIKYYKQYLYPSLNQGTGYIISIIDYFQYFNFFKVVEAGIISKFKTGLKKSNNNTISCVEPKTYSERFIKYVNQLTDISTIYDANEGRYKEIEENNIENNNDIDEFKKRENKENEKEEEMDLYEENDVFKDDDEVKINIKDPQVKFSLRITIMNKNLYTNNNYLNRKTLVVFKRNFSKINEDLDNNNKK